MILKSSLRRWPIAKFCGIARRRGNGVEIHYFGARKRYGAVGTNETHQNSIIPIESQNPSCAKIIQRLQGPLKLFWNFPIYFISLVNTYNIGTIKLKANQ